MPKTYILGGFQTDFARNWRKEEHNLRDVMAEAVHGALDSASMEPGDIDTAHVGNFAGELYAKQGTARRLLRRDQPRLRRPANLPPRGRLRLRQHLHPDGLGRA